MNKMDIAIARVKNGFSTFTEAYHAIQDSVKYFGFKLTRTEMTALIEIASLYYGVSKTKKEKESNG